MEWMIASDSSCEIRTLPDTAPGVQFALVPFKIRVGEREFVDLPTLNTKAMLQAIIFRAATTPRWPRGRWCWKNTPKSRFLCWIP